MATASAEKKEQFNCSQEEFFKIVSDYESYSKFLPEVKSVKITKKSGAVMEMEYSVSLIKTFKYMLKVTEKGHDQIDFVFIGGDVFKTMKGCWKLSEKKGLCQVDYSVEASFGMLVPGALTKTLVTANLPLMMANFKKRVKEVYGK